MYFLVTIIETAQKSTATFDKILKLQQEASQQIQSLGNRAKDAQVVLNHLYKHPLVDAQKVKALTSKSIPSAYTLIEALEKAGILVESTGNKRGKQYVFQRYIDLFK